MFQSIGKSYNPVPIEPQWDLPKRDWITLCELAQANKPFFLKSWNKIPVMERSEIRETIRLLWCREFEHRHLFGHFLRVTE